MYARHNANAASNRALVSVGGEQTLHNSHFTDLNQYDSARANDLCVSRRVHVKAAGADNRPLYFY